LLEKGKSIMSGRLEGKIAVVTGGGQGIGEGISRRFAEEGATVVVTDLNGANAESVAATCGQGSWGFALDVTDGSQIDSAVARVIERHGRIDVLVNNAGVTVVGDATEIVESEWDRAFEINVKANWKTIRAVWPHMIAQGGGSIIVQASCASTGGMLRNLGYTATKGAVLLLAKSAALDGAAHQIRVNAVCPGFIETPMNESFLAAQPDPAAARRESETAIPLGRMGTPEDVAQAFVYLASDEAAWVTGSALAVDGGLTAGL